MSFAHLTVRGIVCAGCTYHIRGARIICLDCIPSDNDYLKTLDFCDSQRCLSANIRQQTSNAFSHSLSHDIIKVRTVHHFRDMYALEEVARAALLSAKQILKYDFGMSEAKFADEGSLDSEGMRVYDYFNDYLIMTR